MGPSSGMNIRRPGKKAMAEGKLTKCFGSETVPTDVVLRMLAALGAIVSAESTAKSCTPEAPIFLASGGGVLALLVVAFLLLHPLHLGLERSQPLHDLVDADGHGTNGFDLAAMVGGKGAGLEEKQLGITHPRRTGLLARM